MTPRMHCTNKGKDFLEQAIVATTNCKHHHHHHYHVTSDASPKRSSSSYRIREKKGLAFHYSPAMLSALYKPFGRPANVPVIRRQKDEWNAKFSLQRVYKDKEISDKTEKCPRIDCCQLGAC
ncbi:unnamed protein product [Pleuronectes platessa]|uniref:Uncharacterized protein n=1 Tax=Pleuronectes platessa TaxID=8262 RepID=A0A9N7V0M9_PLEPL|nr:unnamed protein product [Pleuronectes platessa]